MSTEPESTSPESTNPESTEPESTRPESTNPSRTRSTLIALGLAGLAGWALVMFLLLRPATDAAAAGDQPHPETAAEVAEPLAATADASHSHDHSTAPAATAAAIAAPAIGETHTHRHSHEHTHVQTDEAGGTVTVIHTHSHEHTHSHPGGHDGAEAAGAPDVAGTATAASAPGPEGPAAATAPDVGELHTHDDGTAHTHGAGAPSTWTVRYTPDGAFVPERLDIATGDEVVFVNDSAVPTWPASNIHPTHEILPEFDPLEAIAPGGSWAFTFRRNGYWRYHTHIDAAETGLIVATGGPTEALEPLQASTGDIRFPPAPPGAGGEALFDDAGALEDYVAAYGPAAAVADLKATEIETGRYCHDAAHEAGRIAYEHFGAAAFVLSGHECQAGALHGSTEALFADRGTSRLASDVAALCSITNRFVRHQCHHGVGHGLMAWTSYEIHEALELCDVLEGAEVGSEDRSSCYSGIFMENVVGGLSGAMGHITEYLRPDDPHYPCDVVAERYRADCYYYQTSHMWQVFGGDMSKVAAECATLSDEARRLCFSSYGRDVGNQTRGDPAGAVELCGHAPAGADRIECLTGAAQDRFWETTGADEAITMCSLLRDGEEATACWWEIIYRAGDVFSDDAGRRGFCARLPEDYRTLCGEAIPT